MDDISRHQVNQKRKTLSDIASECFMLILQLRATNNYGNAGALKTKVNEMFEEFEHKGRNAGFENEKILQAKFALVAFLDESIISSSWGQKDEWLSEPLQLKLFDTFNAGEEFFTNINNFRQRTSSNKDVLEIYYICLVLGFKGKYQLQSPENLRRVIDDLNMELHPEMFKAVEAISPNAKPKDSFVQSGRVGIPVWAYPVAAIIISVLFYFVFSLMISGKADTVVETLSKLL